jgi:hypothetical protein
MWICCLAFQTVSVSIIRGQCDECCIHTLHIYTKSCHLSQSREPVTSCPSRDHMGNSQLVTKIHVASCGLFLQCFLSSLICFIMFAARYHKWLRGNPVSLLKLLGCSQSQGLSSVGGPCSLLFLLLHCVLHFYSALCYQ